MELNTINGIVFLKLGGSLITDKQKKSTARVDVIERLADEIASVRNVNPEQKILIGHGSGSFGHMPADRYATRAGIKDELDWLGFLEVWRAASALNRIVFDALTNLGIPVMTFPPSASVFAHDHHVEIWNLEPIRNSFRAGLVPLVYGDVVFDQMLSGTIFSTEELFEYLAMDLNPKRILLAGIEAGVYADYPGRESLYTLITPSMLSDILPNLAGSSATDVTGGMASKVEKCLDLVRSLPGLEISIFSGSEPGLVEQALLGLPVGTLIRADE